MSKKSFTDKESKGSAGPRRRVDVAFAIETEKRIDEFNHLLEANDGDAVFYRNVDGLTLDDFDERLARRNYNVQGNLGIAKMLQEVHLPELSDKIKHQKSIISRLGNYMKSLDKTPDILKDVMHDYEGQLKEHQGYELGDKNQEKSNSRIMDSEELLYNGLLGLRDRLAEAADILSDLPSVDRDELEKTVTLKDVVDVGRGRDVFSEDRAR